MRSRQNNEDMFHDEIVHEMKDQLGNYALPITCNKCSVCIIIMNI